MYLIEKLGLDKCKQIVDGAPELTTNYKDGKYYEEWFPGKWTVFDGKHWQDCKKPKRGLICIINLRTEIANHERTDTCSDIANHISPRTTVIDK